MFRMAAIALLLAPALALAQGSAGNGTINRPASNTAVQVGGQDPAFRLQALKVDSDGNLIVAAAPTAPSSIAANSITPTSGSLVNAVVGKVAPGNLYGVEITTAATAGYLYVFNAIAAPVDGAVTAGASAGNYQHCQAVAASSTLPRSWEIPDRYSVGIVAVFSTTACGTLTKNATPVFLKVRAQ
ncbi:hypothetical protein [Sphingobium sp. YG1]|uniref:hypothetical protein n=1 Tax=Sphingobium sp. YG1 TaxID=2082188 RepID=UPI000DBBA543|nr:hypothetical protein [Sphingobium sp. YG1]BBC99083.1 hypothetical protein YGS_C1P0339 [Sphingobium sp. YG1]